MTTLYIIFGLLLLVIIVDILSKKKKTDSVHTKEDLEWLIRICEQQIQQLETEHPDCIDEFEYWFEKKWEYQKLLMEFNEEKQDKK